MPAEYVTPLIALAGTVFGGAGLEISKRWLNRAKDNDDTQKNLRSEMRQDITTLRASLDKVEEEVAQWREKYYDVLEKYILIKSKYEEAIRQIQSDAEARLVEIDKLDKATPPATSVQEVQTNGDNK